MRSGGFLIQPCRWFRGAVFSAAWIIAFCASVRFTTYAQTGAGRLLVVSTTSDESEVIVRGYIASARIEPHPQLHNLMTVVVQ